MSRTGLEFWRLGVQYYTAARSATLAGLSPVCGNLFHHAVEMFLKARLSETHTLKELKNPKKFGHDLLLLWNAFKAEVSSSGLAQFDATVAALARFEDIRYPDVIVALGAAIRIDWQYPSPPLATTGPEPQYEIFVGDIDRLVGMLFQVCSTNPAFFTGSMNS